MAPETLLLRVDQMTAIVARLDTLEAVERHLATMHGYTRGSATRTTEHVLRERLRTLAAATDRECLEDMRSALRS